MAHGVLTQTDGGKEKLDKSNQLEFTDNKLLIDLCGEFDRNLAELENKLAIQIVRRGNVLDLIGDKSSTETSAQVLNSLYQRLESGKSLEYSDIDREIRLILDGVNESTDQMEMFSNGLFEIRTRKKTVEPRTDAQRLFVKSLTNNELAFGIGPAGTGKTYLAVAVGVSKFIAGEVDKIILSRPAVEAGEKLGYLPGDMKDKVDPYMQPLYDALNDFLPAKQLAKLIEEKTIEIAPLAFMRGRTLAHSYIVLDEAQNATSMQMKMFLTRLGEGSRMVITGDRSQIDLPNGVRSGLLDAESLLATVSPVSYTHLTLPTKA